MLTQVAGNRAAWAGAGLIPGPIIATRLIVPFLGDPRYAYVVAAASVVACVAHLALNFKETLDVDKRKPMVWKDANPLGFLSFLFKSVAMFRLMLISAMQTCIDSRNVFEVKPDRFCASRTVSLTPNGAAQTNMIYQRNTLQMTEGQNGTYVYSSAHLSLL